MCIRCGKKPVYEFTNKRGLCKNCFIRWFQKKFLYTARKFCMLKRGDVIFLKKTNGFREAVLEDVLKVYSKDSSIEIVKSPSKKKTNKIAISNTSDIEADRIIHNLINADFSSLRCEPTEKIKGKIIIKPLYLFLDKEVLIYAKIKKLRSTKKINEEKDEISLFLEDLEKKHPEVKHAVVNSYLEIFENDN